jgi:hypothetical protein
MFVKQVDFKNFTAYWAGWHGLALPCVVFGAATVNDGALESGWLLDSLS